MVHQDEYSLIISKKNTLLIIFTSDRLSITVG